MIVFSKTFLIVISILLLAPFQYLFVKLNVRLKVYIPKLFHKIVLKVIGVKVKLVGKYTKIRPLILIGNHTSYLDIIILGSIMPICFIAKDEIRGWFLFGFLARMQNTIFIKRKNYKTLESLKNINDHIKNESAVVLFPEGTTNTGKKILVFKSSLFNMFENNYILRLQNFSLCYTHVNNMPIDNRTRPQISWYGDMNMISHLTNLLRLSCINVTVVFHKSLPIAGMNRKEISSYSYKQVKEGIDLAIDGI